MWSCREEGVFARPRGVALHWAVTLPFSARNLRNGNLLDSTSIQLAVSAATSVIRVGTTAAFK